MPERSILVWLAIGLAAGVAGHYVASASRRGGMVIHILTGITGALAAGFIAETMQWTPSGTWQNFVVAGIGAIVALATYHRLPARRP